VLCGDSVTLFYTLLYRCRKKLYKNRLTHLFKTLAVLLPKSPKIGTLKGKKLKISHLHFIHFLTAEKFAKFLTSKKAKEVFEKYGFSTPQ